MDYADTMKVIDEEMQNIMENRNIALKNGHEDFARHKQIQLDGMELLKHRFIEEFHCESEEP